MPIYPNVTVSLAGEDGNAFAILGRTKAALKQGGATPDEIRRFYLEATQSSYDNLLQTVMRWVEVE